MDSKKSVGIQKQGFQCLSNMGAKIMESVVVLTASVLILAIAIWVALQS